MSVAKHLLLSTILIFILNCKAKYAFDGGNTGNAKTFQVDFFKNNADLIEPGLDNNFTLSLQDLLQNQTKLSLEKSNGDLLYEGEITEYKISPTTATTKNEAAQNRLTIAVKCHFSNKLNNDEFEKTFFFFYDYPKNSQLVGNLKNEAIKEIFEHITQDIFNESLAKW
jgi:Lipopolysaccharide-assembly